VSKFLFFFKIQKIKPAVTDLRATSSDNDACKQLLLEASTFTTTGKKILRLLLLPLSTTLQATTVVGFGT
jgi:hypothetical protein